MKKVLCGQQKGGVGKSTLAGNLAVGLAKRGRSVIILDTDKQQTCVKWGSRRKLNSIQPDISYASLMVNGNGTKGLISPT
ncbi:MAG: AAA family ATPase [Hyphomicrobiales bacterium]